MRKACRKVTRSIWLRPQFVKWTVALLALLCSPLSFALSLGDVQIDSRLNQPLRGSIPVVAASASELGSLRVGLAGQQDWQRAGLSQSSAVSRIKFGFKSNGGGRLAITLRTDEPISEPLLVFLIDASWSSGHLLREYTVFLDPENMPQRATAPIVAPSVRQSPPILRSNVPNDGAGLSARDAGRYGPVRRGESLSTISESILVGTDLSRHQVVWALYQNNPHAFVNGNINLLTTGANLQVPSTREMESIPPQQARQLVRAAANQQQAAFPKKTADQNPSLDAAKSAAQAGSLEQSKLSPVPSQAPAGASADAPAEPSDKESQQAAEEQGSEPVAASEPAEQRRPANDKLELLPLEPNESVAEGSATAGDGQANQTASDQAVAGTGNADQSGGVSNTPRERHLENENAMLRERIDETEALLKEIRTLLAARSEQLSELQTRLERVETQAQQNQQSTNQPAQNDAPVVGWFWWLLLALAVLIILLLMAGLFLLARRQDREATPSALSYDDESDENDDLPDVDESTSTAATSESEPSPEKQAVDEEVEAFIESNLIMPRPHVSEHVAHEPVAPVLEADDADDELVEATPPVPEVMPESDSSDLTDVTNEDLGVERRLPAEDAPLDFDLDEYAAPKPAEEDSDAGAYEAEIDSDLGSFDDELPVVASAEVEPVAAELEESLSTDDALPILNDDELESLEIESELSAPGAGLAALVAESENELDEGPEVEPVAEQSPASDEATDVSDFSGGDQVATKLDLARVYVDMGDADEARSILSEVLKQGDDHQKQEAQTLLDSLA